VHPRRIVIIFIGTAVLALGSLSLMSGCDNSKTSGTQVQMGPEMKAAIKDMREAQKEVRAERKQEKKDRMGARKKGM
jgi:hypothetical protein